MLGEISFENAVNTLRQNGAKFTQVYNQFIDAGRYAENNPQLYNEWRGVKSKADAVRKTVLNIAQTIDGAFSWFGNTFGLNGIDVLKSSVPNQQNLGLIPLVPVGVVLGASAALLGVITLMTNSIASIYAYKRKADLVESGQANPDILNQQDLNSFTSQMSGVLKFGLVLAAAYFIVPKLMKKS